MSDSHATDHNMSSTLLESSTLSSFTLMQFLQTMALSPMVSMLMSLNRRSKIDARLHYNFATAFRGACVYGFLNCIGVIDDSISGCTEIFY